MTGPLQLIRKGIVGGVDMNRLAARLWRLEAMRAEPGRRLPKIRWRATANGASGSAGRNTLTISISTATPLERIAELLLHELVHCSCPSRTGHSELFKRRLIACAREAFTLELNTDELLTAPRDPSHKCHAYTIDAAILTAMTQAEVSARLRNDPQLVYVAPPSEPPEEARKRVACLAAKRAYAREAKARAKLAEWERRAAAARRIASKWRAKVKYYDRKREAAGTAPK